MAKSLYLEAPTFAYHLGDPALAQIARWLLEDPTDAATMPEPLNDLINDIGNKLSPSQRPTVRACAKEAVYQEIAIRWLNGESVNG